MKRKDGNEPGSIGGAPMSGYASDIAISELTGVPVDDLCGWVVVAIRHTGQAEGSHQPVIVPSDREYVTGGFAAVALERALEDLRGFAARMNAHEN